MVSPDRVMGKGFDGKNLRNAFYRGNQGAMY